MQNLSNLLCLDRCGFRVHLEEDGHFYSNMSMYGRLAERNNCHFSNYPSSQTKLLRSLAFAAMLSRCCSRNDAFVVDFLKMCHSSWIWIACIWALHPSLHRCPHAPLAVQCLRYRRNPYVDTIPLDTCTPAGSRVSYCDHRAEGPRKLSVTIHPSPHWPGLLKGLYVK